MLLYFNAKSFTVFFVKQKKRIKRKNRLKQNINICNRWSFVVLYLKNKFYLSMEKLDKLISMLFCSKQSVILLLTYRFECTCLIFFF